MLQRELREKCLAEIKKRISVPTKNEHIITSDVHRIRYSMDHEMRHIVLDDLHLSQVCLDLNMIQAVDVSGEKVVMYREHYEVVHLPKNQFTQVLKKTIVSREEIVFTYEDIINIAAREELKIIGGVVGMFKAKVIPFTQFIAA